MSLPKMAEKLRRQWWSKWGGNAVRATENNKMAKVSPSLSVLILNVNGLNSHIKM